MIQKIAIFFLIFVATNIAAQTLNLNEDTLSMPQTTEYIMSSFSDDAPPLYAWMLKPDKQRADWLGIKFKGKTLHEPINILICDSFSRSAQEAETKLLSACSNADYLDRYGHSSDYIAMINGVAVSPFPNLKKHSFSDRIFAEANNHGRIFGPVFFKDKYWFYAAFSREKVHIEPLEHTYASFNHARDSFAWSLDATGLYNVKCFVNLGNIILSSKTECSGDHDGIAVLLEAEK